MSRTRVRAAMMFAFASLSAVGWADSPFLFSAVSSASYSSTIAQGSLFVVFGANIGPTQLLPAPAYPLATQLGTTSITVMSGTAILACPMFYTVAGAAAAILPSNTPLGRASISLTYDGQPTPFPVSVNVVAAAPGIFTSTSSGLGPAVVTALDGAVKTFAVPAKPGETVTAWATGLGPISEPDNAVPSTFPNFPGVEVFVGTQAAKVIYAGRSGCCASVDQISFEVPASLSGCYLPVVVRRGGSVSNFVSLAVGSGGACSDAGATLPVSLASLKAGQSVKIAAMSIGPVSVLSGLGFNQHRGVAARLSTLLRVKVAQEDVDKLMLAEQTHDQRTVNRIMAKYGAAWKALSPAGRVAVNRTVSLTQEGVVADFGQYSSPSVLVAALGGLLPSPGTCTVTNLATEVSATSTKGLDVGRSLTLSGQAGIWTMSPTSPGEYQATFGSSPSGPNVPPGNYAIAGAGGTDADAFGATLTVGGNLVWANKQSISTVDRSQGLTVTWKGGTQPGYVLIGGYSASVLAGHMAFTCAEDVSKGSFTIPSFILSAMPAPSNGTMFIGPHPMSRQVTIPGIDLAYFVDGSSDSRTVGYR
jgi:uncharacterized protein (TIGR03437 family)